MNKQTPIVGIQDLEPLFKRLRLGDLYKHALELNTDPQTMEMTHLEWMKTLLETEIERRDSNALARRIRNAHIRHQDACMQRIDFESDRGLDRTKIMTLGNCDWIRNHQNCIITGSTGCGKTWLAGALANAACYQGFSVEFVRFPRFLSTTTASHNIDKEFDRILRKLRSVNLLVLDDFGIGTIDATGRSDLLEIIEDRCALGISTLVTSQLPVKTWASYINDPTIADAILDRLVLNAHRIEMHGQSMRSQEQYGAVK